MNDRELSKLEKALALLDEGGPSTEEVVEAFETIVQAMEAQSTTFGERVEEIKSLVQEIANDSDRHTKNSQFLNEKILEVRRDLRKEIEQIALTPGPAGEKGKDADPKDVVSILIKDKSFIKSLEFPTDTPEEVVSKINKSERKINKDQIDGLKDIEVMAKANQMPITTAFYNGLRAKNLHVEGATATQQGDTVHISLPTSDNEGHVIQDEGSDLPARTNLNFVGPGVTATDDSGNDATIITIPGATGGIETPTGTINGSNVTFTVLNTPVFVTVDGMIRYATLDYTYSAPTITITNGAPPFVSIRSHY